MLVLLLAGWGKPTIDQIAKNAGFKRQYIQTKPFKIATWSKIADPHAAINIYIEGDGRVRRSLSTISRDPTPKSTTLFEMASLDPSSNVVYLARPCQNSPDDLRTVCDSKYWTTARYSDTVVESLSQVITDFQAKHQAKKINLIGYSGGGTIAILLAARRDDIASIITVAGNLDLKTMDAYYNTPPLTESLDPMDVASKVAHIPQLHFVGEKDVTVPRQVAYNFQKNAGLKDSQVVKINGVDHKNGWVERWQNLLEIHGQL